MKRPDRILAAAFAAVFLATATLVGAPNTASAQTVAATSRLPSHLVTNVKTNCGATGNGASDDTAAINKCVALINAGGGGQLYFPCGRYNVTGSGSSVFTTVTARMSVVGAGSCSRIVLNPAIPTTRDLFHFTGAPGQNSGLYFMDFSIVPASTAVGRHMFHFDCTSGGSDFAHVVFHRVTSAVLPVATAPVQPANAAGHVVYIDNTGSIDPNGCVFGLSIDDHDVFAAPSGYNDFDCEQCGDTINISNSQLSGLGGAAFIKQVAGAGNLVIGPGNSITANAMIQVVQAYKPTIFNNEIEQQGTNTEANNAEVDIDGSLSNITNSVIFGNQIQGNSGLGNPYLIRINAATDSLVDANALATPAATTHIINTSASSALIVGAANEFIGGGSNISDSGVGTILAPAAQGAATSLLDAKRGNGRRLGRTRRPIVTYLASGRFRTPRCRRRTRREDGRR